MDAHEPQAAGDLDLARLVRVLIEREQYTETFVAEVEAELSRRGTTRGEVLDAVHVRSLDDPAGKPTSISGALDVLRAGDASPFVVLTGALGDAIGVEKLAGCFALHARIDGDYRGILSVFSIEDATSEAEAFLRLDETPEEIAARYTMDGWETLVPSYYADYVEAMGERLAEAEIGYALHSTRLRLLDPELPATSPRDPIQILVREDDGVAANEVVRAGAERAKALFAEADAHAASGNSASELGVYEQLAGLLPDDPTVAFNRAAILVDLDRPEEAADRFMEAVPLLRSDPKLHRYLGDVESNLVDLLPRYGNPNLIRHALASIAVSTDRGDDAMGHLRTILEADDADAAAHVQLGHHYYEDGDRDAEARAHFQRYLELEPEAPDRATIEEILGQL